MAPLFGFLLWLVIFGVLYSIVFMAFKIVGVADLVRGMRRGELLCMVGGCLAVVVLVWWLISLNQTIYFWDSSGYWEQSITQAKRILSDPWAGFAHLGHSLNNDGYNLLLPTLVSVPLSLFGYSYVAYVIINAVLFLIPTMLAQAACFQRISQLVVPGGNASRRFLFGLLLAALFPMSYIPVLQGYTDAGGLAGAAVLVMLLLSFDPTESPRIQWPLDVIAALLLVYVLLSREYFAFFVVGYVSALVLWSLDAMWRARSSKADVAHVFSTALTNLLVMGGLSLGILVVMFRGFLAYALTSDFSGQYVGYDASLSVKLEQIIYYFGGVCLLIGFLGGIVCLVRRHGRALWVVLVASMLVTMMLFFRIQAMNPHHAYLILNQLFCLESLCISGLLFDESARLASKAVGAVALTGVSLCFVRSFVFVAQPALASANLALSVAYVPARRSDVSQIDELIDRLNFLTEGTSDSVYILASGNSINGDVFRNAYLPQQTDALNNQANESDVDLRDGFAKDFLSARYIVTTTPDELHLAEGSQEVVRFLGQEVKDSSTPIGRHFELMDTCQVQYGIEVETYVKTSDFETSDLQYLADYYSSLYPGHEGLFADRIL